MWYDDLPLVAHNALFDLSFLKSAIKKYALKEFDNTLIDTVELSRYLFPNENRHSLSAVVKRHEIEFDENSHHRADYDATATAYAFYKMSVILSARQIKTTSELLDNFNVEDLNKFASVYNFFYVICFKTIICTYIFKNFICYIPTIATI